MRVDFTRPLTRGWRSPARSLPRLALLVLMAAAVCGGSALSWVAPLRGQLSNFSDPVCAQSFSAELLAALEEQGETPEAAGVPEEP